MSRFGGDGQRARGGVVLTPTGCALFLVSMLVPVMRWSENEYHESAGNARVWFGDGWTLADGGFGGAWFLPVATATVLVLAAAAVLGAWRTQIAAAVVVAYVPAWTAVAFLRKLEDDVDVDLGAGVLLLASLLIAAGLWFGRATSATRSPEASAPVHPTAQPRSQPTGPA